MGYISPIWGADPFGPISAKIGRVIGVDDVIIRNRNQSNFRFNTFRGFRSTGGQNFHFPIDFAGDRYNSAGTTARRSVWYLCVLCSAHWYLAIICFAGLHEQAASDANIIKKEEQSTTVVVCCCIVLFNWILCFIIDDTSTTFTALDVQQAANSNTVSSLMTPVPPSQHSMFSRLLTVTLAMQMFILQTICCYTTISRKQLNISILFVKS